MLNNLAQTLSDEGKNVEARALIERAVALGGPLAGTAEETRTLILRRAAAAKPAGAAAKSD